MNVAEVLVRRPRARFYYGWVNVGVAALAMTATLPGRTHGLGLITEPLLADLAVAPTFYSALNFWAIILGAAFCLPAGRLLDQRGSRLVLTLVSILLGAVVLVMSQVAHWLPLLVLLILVRGLGQGTLSVASTALVGKWFTRRLGAAMGVFAVLLAVGFITATLTVGFWVVEYGWRWAWAAVGLILIVGLAPMSWLLVRDRPEADDAERAADAAARSGPALLDACLSDALRSPAFWCFSAATSLFGLIWSAITLFQQSILAEHGFDAKTFYLVMALLTFSGLVANLGGGWLATRWPLGRLLGLGMVILAAALAAFPFVQTAGQVVAYALVLGGAGGVITVVHFTFYGHAFGRAHLGQIQGAAQVLSVFASAAGPVLAAVSKDWTGSSDLLFAAGAGTAALLGAIVWLTPLPRRPAVAEGSEA